ncbi:hypothetical protein MIND_00123900 [Mycena indigotica]|uniref:Uncharacterized protein n=1 Tax=Mycena indigotica TaxID=2126181 RepID=A0A8H6WKT1_9AGAR|nr:uncharacterized protein MIND_00123900 [Mycena indigotica]KAF7316059.1 hypothetical protein MIND_00123900 [Mycena indigotica]
MIVSQSRLLSHSRRPHSAHSCSMKIIVDDRDPAIKYAPAWKTQGSNGNPHGQLQEFQQTTSQSGGTGSTASFTFTGTQVNVSGTLGGANEAHLEFILDGQRTPITISSAPNPRFHYPVFTSAPLVDGQHTLVMTDNSSDPSPFFFDYLIYTTNSRNSGQTVLIDDADDTKEFALAVLGPWHQNNTFDFMQQTSQYVGSQDAGGAIQLSLILQDGDTLSLFGPLTSTDPQFTSGLPLFVEVTINGNPSPFLSEDAPLSGQITFNQRLFKSSSLSAGRYAVSFEYISGTPFGFDYMLIEPGPGSSRSSSTSSLSPSSTLSTNLTAASTTATNSKASSSSSSLARPTAPNHTSHTGAIVGGVVGGVLLLLIVCVWTMRWARNSRLGPGNQGRAPSQVIQPDVETAIGTITPFPLSKSAVADLEHLRTRAASPEPVTLEPESVDVRELSVGEHIQPHPFQRTVALPTTELVRILNERLRSDGLFDEDEQPPSYPPTEAGNRVSR